MQLNSAEILFFLKISQFTSFTQASDKLDLPQSTISRKILALEHKLGIALFLRTKQGLVVTEFGQKIQRHAELIESQLTTIENLVSHLNNQEHRVSILALPVLANELIENFVPKFLIDYPNILLDIHTMNYESQQVVLDSVIRLQSEPTNQLNYTSNVFVTTTRDYYANPKFLDKFPQLTHPKEIESQSVPCILMPAQGTYPNTWFYQEQDRLEKLNVNGTISVEDGVQAQIAVRNGLGLAWNYELTMKKAVNDGEAIRLFGGEYAQNQNGYVCHRDDVELSLGDKVFLEQLHQHYQPKNSHFEHTTSTI